MRKSNRLDVICASCFDAILEEFTEVAMRLLDGHLKRRCEIVSLLRAVE